ncbi:hypothetical protein ABRQ22_10040 [Cellulosimicrobium sp. ES-005]|uniref:C2H2-type domain-containing protein n=1 Tax=Cellulosimicrobium sp. ES-005 TaxID=3163031 RepID=A0AAU8G502_9MICO
MGFWHTGYMDHAWDSTDPRNVLSHRWIVSKHFDYRVPEPLPKVEPVQPRCATCGIAFESPLALDVHRRLGHTRRRPGLVFQGRECGRQRLLVTRPSAPEDWAVLDADVISIDGRELPADDVPGELASLRSGVHTVELFGAGRPIVYEFDFQLALEEDLLGVDVHIVTLIDGRELKTRSIDDFIVKTRAFPTARRYVEGLSAYLFAALAHEEAVLGGTGGDRFRSGFRKAAHLLGEFDRPPAEAVCGLVAFHLNQFARAAGRTRSPRVAGVSLRLGALASGRRWVSSDQRTLEHVSFDAAFSDVAVENVLGLSAVPFDGTAADAVATLERDLPILDVYDQVKAHLVAAEHYLASGDVTAARRHASALDHESSTREWRTAVRPRLAE